MLKPIQGFFGGNDVQRSTNLADNKCVNLYPTTNDKGDVAGFVSTAGLARQYEIPDGVIASGIYTASNGRCFVAAGVTLYELNADGTMTSRGAIAHGELTKFSDNGIEMIIVTGIAGYIFKFLDNTLLPITVATGKLYNDSVDGGTRTVFSTSIPHNLSFGDVIQCNADVAGHFSGSGITQFADYYVKESPISSTTITITAKKANSSSGIHVGAQDVYIAPPPTPVAINFYASSTYLCANVPSAVAAGLVTGDRIIFGTNGVLPSDLVAGQGHGLYYTEIHVGAFDVGGIPSTTDFYVVNELGQNLSYYGSNTGSHTVRQSNAVATFKTIGYGFPSATKSVSYMNGRFVACEPNTQNFYVSDPLNGGYWDALNVQTVDSNPDKLVGEIVSHNECIMFCEQSGEVFYDSGTIPSPFIRNASGIFEVGCVAQHSIAKIDNSVMWLGRSSTGSGIVYRLNGFTPMRISTYSIEYAIQNMARTDDAIAIAYQQDGHHFYVLTFPTGKRTFVYDLNTQIWHERASFSSGSQSRWDAQQYAFFNGKHLVCDYAEGLIYSIEPTVHSDGLANHKWIRSFRAPATNSTRAIHHKLVLECETGVGVIGGDAPQVMMRYSDDGGHTWSAESWRDLGVADYAKRIFWLRLGMTKAQPRIYEFSGTAAVKTTLLNAFLE